MTRCEIGGKSVETGNMRQVKADLQSVVLDLSTRGPTVRTLAICLMTKKGNSLKLTSFSPKRLCSACEQEDTRGLRKIPPNRSNSLIIAKHGVVVPMAFHFIVTQKPKNWRKKCKFFTIFRISRNNVSLFDFWEFQFRCKTKRMPTINEAEYTREIFRRNNFKDVTWLTKKVNLKQRNFFCVIEGQSGSGIYLNSQ